MNNTTLIRLLSPNGEDRSFKSQKWPIEVLKRQYAKEKIRGAIAIARADAHLTEKYPTWSPRKRGDEIRMTLVNEARKDQEGIKEILDHNDTPSTLWDNIKL